jgi:Lysine methyltransferase
VFFLADVMYLNDAIPALVTTLQSVGNMATDFFIAHGRNRQAEQAFFEAVDGQFIVADVDVSELDDDYQADDIRVMRLKKCYPHFFRCTGCCTTMAFTVLRRDPATLHQTTFPSCNHHQ